MAVARAVKLQPLQKSTVPVTQAALVIGGGVAGMTAALSLAGQGFLVHLVEREIRLGGNLHQVWYLESGEVGNWESGELGPQEYLSQLIGRVENEPLISVYLETELLNTTGFQGNFVSELQAASGEISEIAHGATIVATGGVEYKGNEYGYGSDPRIMTQQEFETVLGKWESRQVGKWASGQAENSELETPTPQFPNSLVMIQCVGPAEEYCSRICCTTALKNALKLKELNPQAQITVIYRDLRVYGSKEQLYTQAREEGVLFVRYDFELKPQVTCGDDLTVQVYEPQLGKELTLTPDLLVLSTPVVPSPGARELVRVLKVSVDLDGFFMEAHVKLRPVDFANDGVFMAGMAHYPKLLDETIVQAQAAAARAATILSKSELSVGGVVAEVDAELCVGCLTCVRACPYDVPQIDMSLAGVGGIMGAAYINPAQCRGCGICAGECPAKAIQLAHYRDEQMESKIDAFFSASETQIVELATLTE
jgi:heterodisulfide reductase subunit A-like polyferredoxin